MDGESAGRLFRTAWVNGVRQHYPGTPKDGYVSPWEEMPEWERESAQAVAEVIASLVRASGDGARKPTRGQRGQFVATAWLAQIYKHFPDPKPSYVSPCSEMPDWQRETDSDIFDAVEAACAQRPTIGFDR
jgi:hypothetical protein